MRLTAVMAALFAAALVTGCGQNVCEEACEKQKGCLEKIDCSALDGAEQAACEMAKQMLEQADCSAAADGCTGDAEQAAKALISCELDPRTCSCGAEEG